MKVPDVLSIPNSHHDLYYVSVRDPLDRFKSAFTYTHPLNRKAQHQRGGGIDQKKNREAFACFPTLEDFARHYHNTTNNHNCAVQAKAAINGNIKIMVHMWANYEKYTARIPLNSTVFVIRTNHLWQDWLVMNKMLDPTRRVYIPYNRHARNVHNLTLPVTRNISKEGQGILCEALKKEYRIYFDLLNRAVNMNEEDIQEARDIASKNCPKLIL